MAETFFVSSTNGDFLRLGIFTLIALLVGGVAFAVARLPQTRRDEFQTPKGCSTRLATALGVLLAVAIVVSAWYSNASRFTSVTHDGARVVLHYSMPARDIIVAAEELVDVRPNLGSQHGIAPTIVLRDGRRLTGRTFRSEDFEIEARRLLDALNPVETVQP